MGDEIKVTDTKALDTNENREMELKELEKISGGTGLRDVPKTKTIDISQNMKNKI